MYYLRGNGPCYPDGGTGKGGVIARRRLIKDFFLVSRWTEASAVNIYKWQLLILPVFERQWPYAARLLLTAMDRRGLIFLVPVRRRITKMNEVEYGPETSVRHVH
jgi:hypothetical protein